MPKPMRPRLETLTLLHHIHQNFHMIPASALEISGTSGMFRMALLARLKKFAAAGWLTMSHRRYYLESRGEYKVMVFQLAPMGLQLLRDNEHRQHEYRVLAPKPVEAETEPRALPNIRRAPTSVFDLAGCL